MTAENEARNLLACHGARASQLVLDEIVAAIKRGDDVEADRRGKVLQALDALSCSAAIEHPAPIAEVKTRERGNGHDASVIRGIICASAMALTFLGCVSAVLLILKYRI